MRSHAPWRCPALLPLELAGAGAHAQVRGRRSRGTARGAPGTSQPVGWGSGTATGGGGPAPQGSAEAPPAQQRPQRRGSRAPTPAPRRQLGLLWVLGRLGCAPGCRRLPRGPEGRLRAARAENAGPPRCPAPVAPQRCRTMRDEDGEGVRTGGPELHLTRSRAFQPSPPTRLLCKRWSPFERGQWARVQLCNPLPHPAFLPAPLHKAEPSPTRSARPLPAETSVNLHRANALGPPCDCPATATCHQCLRGPPEPKNEDNVTHLSEERRTADAPSPFAKIDLNVCARGTSLIARNAP